MSISYQHAHWFSDMADVALQADVEAELSRKDAEIAALRERCERLAREVKLRRHLAYTGKDRGVAYATRAVDDHKDLDAPPAAWSEASKETNDGH